MSAPFVSPGADILMVISTQRAAGSLPSEKTWGKFTPGNSALASLDLIGLRASVPCSLPPRPCPVGHRSCHSSPHPSHIFLQDSPRPQVHSRRPGTALQPLRSEAVRAAAFRTDGPVCSPRGHTFPPQQQGAAAAIFVLGTWKNYTSVSH